VGVHLVVCAGGGVHPRGGDVRTATVQPENGAGRVQLDLDVGRAREALLGGDDPDRERVADRVHVARQPQQRWRLRRLRRPQRGGRRGGGRRGGRRRLPRSARAADCDGQQDSRTSGRGMHGRRTLREFPLARARRIARAAGRGVRQSNGRALGPFARGAAVPTSSARGGSMFRILCAAVACAAFAACVRNPATGNLQLNLVSESQEIDMGKQAAQDVEQSIGLYKDAKLTAYVSKMGQSLAQHTNRKNLPWQFHVVEDAAVNAFALPGGPVYGTRDMLGYAYMANDGYDPRQMVDVFKTLERVSKLAGGGKLPEWLQTHPDPGNREKAAEERLKDLKMDFSKAKVNRDEYLGVIDGLVYGEDPRQGYFQGSRFLHPDLKFQLTFPEGWKTQNTPQAVAGISPKQDAIVQLATAGKMSPEEAAQ